MALNLGTSTEEAALGTNEDDTSKFKELKMASKSLSECRFCKKKTEKKRKKYFFSKKKH